ncbi:MAG: Gfo/Idh/MocA family oxidoreductase [Deltaproteobacteria bacterium]|nr:Gfo/Idh/MocA family oxidoreductase [Deltaproteobacteria bacterium]
MKVVIFGAGLIGKKRGLQLAPHELVGIFDPDQARAKALAAELKTKAFDNEAAALGAPSDVAIVAVTNNALTPVSVKALEAGRHVLVEKPAALSLAELSLLEAASRRTGRAVKVGFNHRFHPSLLKARELVDSGRMGPLMFLRARYGHGGRLGMEKEWRFDPKLGGGGELIDQGVHLLDLIHWFFGPLPLQSSLVRTNFWPAEVDDNAVLTCAAEEGEQWATFHVSCSEWKNTFSLELYGRTGKILVTGLGGSYGKETLTYYQMQPEMGPPPFETFEFEGADRSWELDLKNLVDHVEKKTPLLGDLASARYCLEQVTAAYRANGYLNLPCNA